MPWQMYRQRIKLHIEYKIYSFENEKLKEKKNCTAAFAAKGPQIWQDIRMH